MPWLLTPILMLGGTYLCYEGAEKIWEKVSGHEHAEEEVALDPAEREKQVTTGAIRTDFILSAEIMVIALNEVADEPFVSRAVILVVVAIVITVLVYGVVGLIVKMDDIGLHLAGRESGTARAVGRGMVAGMPKLLAALSTIGIVAMLWVGGHILLVGVDELGWHWSVRPGAPRRGGRRRRGARLVRQHPRVGRHRPGRRCARGRRRHRHQADACPQGRPRLTRRAGGPGGRPGSHLSTQPWSRGMPSPTPRVGAGMTTWGFIGSGNIGSTVARLAVDAGHDVVLSNSRGPETLADLVAELGPRARAATAEEAARAGDLVVVTVPLKARGDLPHAALAGKVVIDTMNYYPQRDGVVPELEDESTTTSELLQALAPDAKVVKGFNNIFVQHLAALARPAGADDRSALAIAGDDLDAKEAVRVALDEIGYDTVDLGPLAQGWRTQRDTAAYGSMYAKDPEDWTRGARPADRDAVAAAALRARRYRDS